MAEFKRQEVGFINYNTSETGCHAQHTFTPVPLLKEAQRKLLCASIKANAERITQREK